MPPDTKRIAGTAHQPPPHRPVQAIGSPKLQPCFSALPSLCYPKLPPLRPSWSLLAHALRPAKPAIHTCMISTRLHPQACTGLYDLRSASPHPSGLPSWQYTHTHNFYCAMPLRPVQDCTVSAGTMSLKLTKLAIHRHAQSPFCQACALQACQAHAPKAC
jgi:hypothetical protein